MDNKNFFYALLGKRKAVSKYQQISEKVPYVSRATGGLISVVGSKANDVIVGGSIVWNQQVQNGNFADGDTNWATNRGTISVSNNIATFTCDNTGGNPGINSTKKTDGGIKKDHIYLFGATINPSVNVVAKFTLSGGASSGSASSTIAVNANTWTRVEMLWKYDSDFANGYPYFYMRDALSVGDTIQYKDCVCFDLTQMFGSTIANYIYGLETASRGAGVSFFKALFPENFYASNLKELMSVNAVAHRTYDVNGMKMGDYELADITLHGMPKLDNSNHLYYDGDTYESDGTVTRKYAKRAYQAGDESLEDAITDGTNTIYKLVTSTTEVAASFADPQAVDPNGSEEYVDGLFNSGMRDVAIPVGHITQYRIAAE